jgi:hypothetical protein
LSRHFLSADAATTGPPQTISRRESHDFTPPPSDWMTPSNEPFTAPESDKATNRKGLVAPDRFDKLQKFGTLKKIRVWRLACKLLKRNKLIAFFQLIVLGVKKCSHDYLFKSFV